MGAKGPVDEEREVGGVDLPVCEEDDDDDDAFGLEKE